MYAASSPLLLLLDSSRSSSDEFFSATMDHSQSMDADSVPSTCNPHPPPPSCLDRLGSCLCFSPCGLVPARCRVLSGPGNRSSVQPRRTLASCCFFMLIVSCISLPRTHKHTHTSLMAERPSCSSACRWQSLEHARSTGSVLWLSPSDTARLSSQWERQAQYTVASVLSTPRAS